MACVLVSIPVLVCCLLRALSGSGVVEVRSRLAWQSHQICVAALCCSLCCRRATVRLCVAARAASRRAPCRVLTRTSLSVASFETCLIAGRCQFCTKHIFCCVRPFLTNDGILESSWCLLIDLMGGTAAIGLALRPKSRFASLE